MPAYELNANSSTPADMNYIQIDAMPQSQGASFK